MFDPKKPFNELPLLPPSEEVETKAVLKACIQARTSLAELKELCDFLPNPAVLINSITLLEAKASSEIENIVTTTDRLFRSANALNEATDPATKEALMYRTALYHGFLSLQQRPLNTTTAIDVCRIILGIEIDVRKIPGTVLKNDRTKEVIYTPPEGENLLREKLSNWEKFLHESYHVDPLVRLAIQHYQFEAIHPFADGNGRTGRILNLIYLVQEQLLPIPILYLSRAILETRTEYYQLLLKVTKEKAWEDWILYFLKAVHQTALWTTSKIRAIRKLMEKIGEEISENLPSIYSRELVELLFVLPYCRISDVVKTGIAQRQTASVYLHQLVDKSFLKEIKAGREKIFINHQFLNLLKEGE